MTGSHGHQVEEAARLMAAALGVADFVYTVPEVRAGGRTREVGDALLISNGLGAVLQVKSRDPSATGKAEGWIETNGLRAYRQGVGSLGEIRRHIANGAPLLAIPVRASDFPSAEQATMGLLLDEDPSGWPLIVIIDHPDAVGVMPPEGERAFWITLDDWHELNRALRSTTGLLVYVDRVLAHGTTLKVPLGQEQDRFAALVEADRLHAEAGTGTSRPWLSFDALDDPFGADLYRELLVGVWPLGYPRPKVPIEDVRRVLEFLDAAPPGTQVRAGRWIQSKRRDAEENGRRSSGMMMFDRARILVFLADVAANYDNLQEFDAVLAALGALRANEATEHLGQPIPTLAIGHLVATDGVDYRYILTPEPLNLPDTIRRDMVHRFGLMTSELQVQPVIGEPDELCPCGSGLPFGECRTADSR